MIDLYPGSPASRGALPVLTEADDKIRTSSGDQSDGKWLEEVTVRALPHIRELDVADCWSWQDWPDKHRVLPGAPVHDWVGIDAVAQRRSDKRWVAIQVKARQLDADGTGNPVAAGELDKFLAGASNRDVWAERWLIVNGSVELGGHSPEKVAMSGAPVNPLNLAQLIQTQIHELTSSQSDASSLPPGEGASQNRAEMQKEAVEMAVARLRENELQDEDGIPKGEARGRIVLPCGAGKTRIALRIVERLTNTGELSVVLCPSIALVAQLRREFLNYAQAQLRTLAVCSDQTVAANEEQITQSDDLTADRGMVSTEVLRGCPVTTDPNVIAAWIKDRREGDASQMVSVIFSTYQSGARLAEAFKRSDAADAFKVLICDEAHRTAGVRRRKRSTDLDDAVREFTLCHDRDAFPATYRVYQTATPRIYGDAAQAVAAKRADRSDFVVRHMDDQAVFGIELYRRSYHDAVTNGWLSDYRIIAMGISGKEAVDVANTLVREADEQAEFEAAEAEKGMTSKSRRKRGQELPTTGDYLKGMAFALAIGGGAVDPAGGRVPIKSCIGFLNTIARSKTMTTVLQSQAVRDWVAGQLPTPPPPRTSAAPHYRLEHLDASSPVARRDEAKRRLAAADAATPHSILNVGIFGEGTDSPSLSAVAFLEPRKSPIDVVQAVGRAMRRAQGKELGYIIVPVVIPEGADAETFLATSDKHEGWRELGDILQALRAHDQRIEDALPQMLTIQLPAEQPQLLELRTVVAVGRPERKQLEYAVVTGSHDDAEDTAREAVATGCPLLDFDNTEPLDEGLWESPTDEPASVIVHAQRSDGSTVTSQDTVVRKTPKPHQDRGDINVNQTKRRAVEMAKGTRGARRPDPAERARRRQERDKARQARQAAFEASIQGVLVDLQSQIGDSISMNLLEKSGLTGNRITRDLNLLRNAVEEAARYLHQETGLAALLDSHFELDNLAAPKAGKQRADGATIAALLWMNAAMLHQRIHAGGWLGSRGIDSLESVKASSEPEEVLRDSWEVITRQDFLPVLEPALDALRTARRSGRLGGLRRALRHLAAEAERIAETYADMGADHAGALFNKVMGDQSSDGAFFTRPVAADIAARLALQAVDPNDSLDWSDSEVWRAHKTVDLACGSGTLLTAVMTEMKRRAERSGADLDQLADLQKLAAEDVLKGLDINPVSLQLAATQLMSGNRDIKYRRMGLHRMPYGPQPDGSSAAGTLELLARSEIIDSGRLFDDAADSDTIKTGAETDSLLKGPEMDDAAAAAANARIVIMNPPFTNRSKAGEKFDTDEQRSLRHRMDALEQMLVASDDRLNAVLDKNSIGPMFTTLAQCCLSVESGSSIALLAPTIKATAASNAAIRLLMAERLHVHTILTCHDPGSVNLSQNTAINESVFVFQRRDSDDDPPPPTRIIALDRLPTDSEETDDLFDAIAVCGTGALPDGWGEVSSWPAERIRAGDWSAAVWRSPALASAAAGFAAHDGLTAIQRERERERETDTQDRADAQRRLPPQHRRSTRTMIHATLQPLYADYRKATARPGIEA